MGESCEFCRPFFVGDPRNGSKCVPCLTYCNGHSEFCFGQSLINNSTTTPGSLSQLTLSSDDLEKVV